MTLNFLLSKFTKWINKFHKSIDFCEKLEDILRRKILNIV